MGKLFRRLLGGSAAKAERGASPTPSREKPEAPHLLIRLSNTADPSLPPQCLSCRRAINAENYIADASLPGFLDFVVASRLAPLYRI